MCIHFIYLLFARMLAKYVGNNPKIHNNHHYIKELFFAGYASVFNVKDMENDIINPNAFKNIDLSKLKLLYQHNYQNQIGYIRQAKQDEYGLYVEGHLSSVFPYGKTVIDLIDKKVNLGLSIGFLANQYHLANGIKYINSVDLFEISFVSQPTNPHAKLMYVEKIEH